MPGETACEALGEKLNGKITDVIVSTRKDGTAIKCQGKWYKVNDKTKFGEGIDDIQQVFNKKVTVYYGGRVGGNLFANAIYLKQEKENEAPAADSAAA